MPAFYVYILKCNDASYYTGHTDDIERRLAMHNEGKIDSYTATRLPVELVY
jgi:predicted GIY-YIG superfamily endonuclease